MRKLLSIVLLITAVVFNSCKEDVAVRIQKNTEKKVQQLSYSFNSNNNEASVKSGNESDSTSQGVKILSTETWEAGGDLFTANLIEGADTIKTKADPTQQIVSGSGVYTFYAYKEVDIKEQSITETNKKFEVPIDEGTKYGIIFFSTVENGGVPSKGSLKKDLVKKEMIYEAKANENLGYKVYDKGTMPGSTLIDEIIFTPVFSQLSLSVPRDLVGSIVTVNEAKILGGVQDKATVSIKYNSEATSNIDVTYTQTNKDYTVNLKPVLSGDFTVLEGNYYNFIPNGNASKLYLKMTTAAGATVEKEFNMKDKSGAPIVFKGGRRYKLSIDNQTLVSLAIEPAEATLINGEDTKLKLMATYSGGAKVDVSERAEWVSSVPTAATVSNVADTKGLVKAVGVGESIITAKFAGKEAISKVKVTSDITEIRVTPNPAEVAKGKTVSLTATAIYQDGTEKDVTKDANVNWESVTQGIASVEAKTGVVKGELEGSTKVKATYGGKTGEATVNVTSSGPEIISFTASPTSIKAYGGKSTLKAVVRLADGSTYTNINGIQFTSNNPVSIPNPGTTPIATGYAPGKAVITARYGNLTKSVTITVTGTFNNLGLYYWDGKSYGSHTSSSPGYYSGIRKYDDYGNPVAVASCKNAPSDEQLKKYLAAGVYWVEDGPKYYAVDGKTYTCGLMVMRNAYISGFESDAPIKERVSIKHGYSYGSLKGKYFFLPAYGYKGRQFTYPGLKGGYWLRTPYGDTYGYYLEFYRGDYITTGVYSSSFAEIKYGSRDLGNCIMPLL